MYADQKSISLLDLNDIKTKNTLNRDEYIISGFNYGNKVYWMESPDEICYEMDILENEFLNISRSKIDIAYELFRWLYGGHGDHLEIL